MRVKGVLHEIQGEFSYFSDKVLDSPVDSAGIKHMEIKAIHSLLLQNVSRDTVLESHLWSEC